MNRSDRSDSNRFKLLSQTLLRWFLKLVTHKKCLWIILFHFNRLHHQLSFTVFLVASALSSMSQVFGEPIHCEAKGVDSNVFKAHCWSLGTYTLPYNPAKVSSYPGVSPHRPSYTQYQPSPYNQHIPAEEGEKYHSYYQWVGLFLFLQAAFNSVPWFDICWPH